MNGGAGLPKKSMEIKMKSEIIVTPEAAKEAMERLGSQRKAAAELGIHRGTLGRLLNGKPVKVAEKISVRTEIKRPSAEVAVVIPGGHAYPTGFIFEKKPTFDEWARIYMEAQRVNSASMWLLGDIYRYGEDAFHDMAAQVVDPSDSYAVQTLQNAAWVCGKVPHKLRFPDVSYGHYERIAKLDEKEIEFWVDRIRKDHLSIQDVRKLLAKKKARDTGEAAKESSPARVTGALADFGNAIKDAFKEMPKSKWEPEALGVVQRAWQGVQRDVNKLMFGENEQETA
jgi:hypothetical protein